MKLLFICTHNRCRSILAEAISNHVAGGKIIAASAGSSPQGAVHPLSLKYLAEHQIPIDGLQSQSWDEFESFSPDGILTLCDSAANETCPVWFDNSAQVLWGLADPSREQANDSDQAAMFAQTIDILTRRIEAVLQPHTVNLRGEALQTALRQIAIEIQ